MRLAAPSAPAAKNCISALQPSCINAPRMCLQVQDKGARGSRDGHGEPGGDAVSRLGALLAGGTPLPAPPDRVSTAMIPYSQPGSGRRGQNCIRTPSCASAEHDRCGTGPKNASQLIIMPNTVRCRRYAYINLHALGVPNVLCAWVRPHVRFLLHVALEFCTPVAEVWTPVPLPVLVCQGGDIERAGRPFSVLQTPAEH